MTQEGITKWRREICQHCKKYQIDCDATDANIERCMLVDASVSLAFLHEWANNERLVAQEENL